MYYMTLPKGYVPPNKKAEDEKAKQLADEKAKQLADEKAKQLADEKAKQLADEKAKQLADEKAKQLADEKAKQLADEKAKQLADEKAKQLADEKAKQLADEKAKQLADEKAIPRIKKSPQNQKIKRYTYATIPSKICLEDVKPLRVILKVRKPQPPQRNAISNSVGEVDISFSKNAKEVPVLVVVDPDNPKFEIEGGEYYKTIN